MCWSIQRENYAIIRRNEKVSFRLNDDGLPLPRRDHLLIRDDDETMAQSQYLADSSASDTQSGTALLCVLLAAGETIVE